MGGKRRHDSLFGVLAISFTLTAAAQAIGAPVSIVLVTTPKYNDEIRVMDGNMVAKRPGHHAELIMQAGERCGAIVEFRFLPWQRALLMVKNGDADGAFSASYDLERASYGVYPMVGEKPDTTRALKEYSYSLYARYGSQPGWDGRTLTGHDHSVAVERGASIIPRLGELGLAPVEVADNATLLRMVAGGRVPAAAVMTAAADAILADSAELARAVVKLEPPLDEKFGYVMLSKHFYARHRELGECFWNTLRDIRATPEHRAVIRSYQAEKS